MEAVIDVVIVVLQAVVVRKELIMKSSTPQKFVISRYRVSSDTTSFVGSGSSDFVENLQDALLFDDYKYATSYVCDLKDIYKCTENYIFSIHPIRFVLDY